MHSGPFEVTNPDSQRLLAPVRTTCPDGYVRMPETDVVWPATTSSKQGITIGTSPQTSRWMPPIAAR